MKIITSVLFASMLTITLSAPAYAQRATSGNGQHAPLPEQIVSAKTVFLMNETGKAKFGDAIYKQIKIWNRWQVVASKDQADLVLVVTDKGGMGSMNPSFYLNVIDRKTGAQLWTCRTTMQGKLWRSWGSVAETLLGDIRKRLRETT